MNLAQLLLTEFDREAVATRRILERVPDQLDWRPHPKSMPLGRLAGHVAELPSWLSLIVNGAEYDPASGAFKPYAPESPAALLAFFDERLAAGRTELGLAADEALQHPWTLRAGDHVIMQSTRYHALRHLVFNHQVHHRGQLSVYLRLLDIPVPGLYGPSFDDRAAMQAAA